MPGPLMIGIWRLMIKAPPARWQAKAAEARRRISARRSFMTPEHQRVHHYVVAGLPGFGGPLPPEEIGRALGLSAERVSEILADLERHMSYVWRDPEGRVLWAYPVTAETTPHLVRFAGGETVHAA